MLLARRWICLLGGLSVLVAGIPLSPRLLAHHEAIFGPQSTTLVSRKRFVSAQYYLTNRGRQPAPESRSHIGLLSASTSVGKRWSIAATLPVEAEQKQHGETEAGLQDLVLAVRYFPGLGPDQTLIAAFTVEPPTGTLEHDALGLGGGLVYGVERRNWSILSYGLDRTEIALQEGEKRGNRLFLGGGFAYERHNLAFSPQLGISWEHAGKRREHGMLVAGSHTSALMLHPTLAKTFGDSVYTFLVVSVPVAQGSGPLGWQKVRIAAGVVWGF